MYGLVNYTFFFILLWPPRRYRTLVSSYTDVLLAQTFGHIHSTRIRTLTPEAIRRDQRGSSALLVAASVSPSHGNNPSVGALIFNTQQTSAAAADLVLRDYLQYTLPLYGFIGDTGEAGAKPKFSYAFSLLETFGPVVARRLQLSQGEGPHHIDGTFARTMGEVLAVSPVAYALYEWHGAAGGGHVSSRVSSCEVLAMTPEERKICLENTQPSSGL